MSRHTDHLSLRVTPRRTQTIINVLQEKHSADFCTHYGEPGYHDPEVGVVFCDWNPLPGWVGEYLEAAGYETQWSDEWIIDYENDKAYRTSPDCYSWTPSTRYTQDGELLTPDDPVEDWIELCRDDPNHALPDWISADDLLSAGWTLDQADFENGLFPGMCDDPATILEAAQKRPEVESVLFQLTEQSQFYCRFRVWILPRDVADEPHDDHNDQEWSKP